MSQQSIHSFLNPKVSCIARVMQLFKHKVVYATSLQNHKLIYLQFWCAIHKVQAVSFIEAEMAITTTRLVIYFLHGSVRQILLSLVYCFKPLRFYSQRAHQVSWPYTHKPCKTGSVKPPCCGMPITPDLHARPLVVALVGLVSRENKIGYT